MIGAAALLALQAIAPPDDARARDAVRLFASLCASARGAEGVAAARLGDAAGMGRRLSATEVAALHDGRAGGAAWHLQSPGGATLLLDYDRGAMCAVRVARADGRSLRAAFDLAARQLAEGFGSMLSALPSTGGPARITGYTYLATGRTATLTLVSDDAAGAAWQHVLRFDLVD